MKVKIIEDFIIGLSIPGPILIIHGFLTQTQFFGFISDLRTALMVSMVLSIILFIIYISLSIFILFKIKRPILFIGSLISILLVYFLFEIVRHGFAIFFEFI